MFKIIVVLLSALKFGKILTVVGTMAFSVLAYSLIYGWRYALGFVLLIFVHEMGHFIAARQKGLLVGVPTFIPFVGAWIELKDKPHNAETEAYVGFAGPLLGTLGALFCYFISSYYEKNLMLALSYAGFFLNLFNLIPLSPFDGGRITAVLSPRLWFIGVPILVGLFLWHHNPLLIIMAILAIPQLQLAFKYNPKAPQNAAYYSTSLLTKLTYGFLYLGLAAFLSIMSFKIHNIISPQ
jgi:Zn-dependent protease